MSEHRVYVVGSINQDLLISTSIYPKLGETVHGHSAEYDAGGKGANQAVAAAKRGLHILLEKPLHDSERQPASWAASARTTPASP